MEVTRVPRAPAIAWQSNTVKALVPATQYSVRYLVAIARVRTPTYSVRLEIAGSAETLSISYPKATYRISSDKGANSKLGPLTFSCQHFFFSHEHNVRLLIPHCVEFGFHIRTKSKTEVIGRQYLRCCWL